MLHKFSNNIFGSHESQRVNKNSHQSADIILSAVKMETTSSSNLICHALRLRPGTELKSSLEKFVVEKGLKSAFILTCVGSVTKATLRLAQKNEASDLENEVGLLHRRGKPSAWGKSFLYLFFPLCRL